MEFRSGDFAENERNNAFLMMHQGLGTNIAAQLAHLIAAEDGRAVLEPNEARIAAMRALDGVPVAEIVAQLEPQRWRARLRMPALG